MIHEPSSAAPTQSMKYTKTSFTPGPWSIDYETRPAEVCTVYGVSGTPDDQGYLYVRGGIGNWDADEDTRRANANLIAAAPDLYAALELLYHHAALYMNIAGNVTQDVLNALNKARGDKP
jgi:hypothetical protein